jgi:hypothetical protein
MKIPALCKKITDPPEETVGAWEKTRCEMCSTELRTTIIAREAFEQRGLVLFPICFDCAVKGPDGIYQAMYDLSGQPDKR